MKETFRKKKIFGWPAIGGFLLVAMGWHIPLFFAIDSKPIVPQPFLKPDKNLYIVMEPIEQASLSDQFLWLDPTVYLLSSDIGFSARMRKISASTKMAVNDPLPPALPRFLQAKQAQSEFTAEEAIVLAERALENQTDMDASAPSLEKVSTENKTSWYVMGSIAERLILPSSLSLTASYGMIKPTVLWIGITAYGDVQFIVLEQSSGLSEADEVAIRFAKKDLKFRPLFSEQDNSVDWGFVKILWQGEGTPKKL